MGYKKVVSVISKQPDFRQDFEIQDLLPWFRRKSNLFKNMKTDCLRDIVRNCSLVSFKKDDVIIRQGEMGECCYIILAGFISIFIINKDREGGAAAGEGATGEGEKKGEEDDRNVYANIGALTDDGRLDRRHLGNFVTSLGSGIPFGEVALMSEDCIRTATIIAEEDTDLIMVDRALYNRAVRDVLKAEFKEKRRFIKHNPLFAQWAPKYKKQLAMAMYMESYPYDGVLVRQGEPVSNIYFIVSGQIEFRTDPSLHRVQYPKLFQLLESERDRMIREKRAKPPSEPQPAPPLKKRDQPKAMKLCYLGINESMGEIEVLSGMETYMQTAVCTEKTEVLVLELKHFERLFLKRHQKTIEEMRQRVSMRLTTRNYALSLFSREVPLLKLIQIKLELIRHPQPTQEKKYRETSVKCAERLFFNKKGPLLDFNGPGSVFFMIRVREKSRMRLKTLQKDREKFKPKPGQEMTGRVPAIQVAHSVTTTADRSGTADTNYRTGERKGPLGELNEIEFVAIQNTPDNTNSTSAPLLIPRIGSSEPRSRSSRTGSGGARPVYVRSIHSAEKYKRPYDVDANENVVPTNKFNHVKPMSSSRLAHTLPIREPDIHLGVLEARVHEWLASGNPKGVPNVSKLRRLDVADLETRPWPGNKVVIRRRARNNHSESSTMTGYSSNSAEHSSGRTRKQAKPGDPDAKFRILLSQ